MPDHLKKKLLLVGSGLMAAEYAKVLGKLNLQYDVVGRGDVSAQKFENQFNKKVHKGGIQNFFTKDTGHYTHAIVTTGIDHLSNAAMTLLENNVGHILLEKPGGMNTEELKNLQVIADSRKAKIFIAYNRRFYASVLEAQRIIEKDGGVSSFHFEFTEWSHVIEPLTTPLAIKNKWFLANSTHVADLAFFLGGEPKEMTAYLGGKLDWHGHSKFTGAGISVKGAPFSYHANWASPGRWSVEILTSAHRLYFKPMESLQIQKTGSVKVEPVEIEDGIDKEFKPGIYRQTEAFIKGDERNFCTLKEQVEKMKWYDLMSGYDPK
jgi:predicted dehydrogenase